MPLRVLRAAVVLIALLAIGPASLHSPAAALAAASAHLELFSPTTTPRTALARGAASPGATFARLAADALERAAATEHATVTLPTSAGPMVLLFPKFLYQM